MHSDDNSIYDVPGTDLDRSIGFFDWCFRGFAHFFKTKAGGTR
jgi:hypothetical protein